MSEKPISPLRARMIEDMTVRNFVEKTKNDHIRHVKTFAAFLGRSPHLATPDDLRSFQVHQTETGVRPPTINGSWPPYAAGHAALHACASMMGTFGAPRPGAWPGYRPFRLRSDGHLEH